MADEVNPFKSLTINCNNKELNLSWTTLRKSEVSKTTYFSPFLVYNAIIKLMKSLKSIIFSKVYARNTISIINLLIQVRVI